MAQSAGLSTDVEATRHAVLILFFLAVGFIAAANFLAARERLLLLANVLVSVWRLYRMPGLGTAWNVVFAIAVLGVGFLTRTQALTVQDRGATTFNLVVEAQDIDGHPLSENGFAYGYTVAVDLSSPLVAEKASNPQAGAATSGRSARTPDNITARGAAALFTRSVAVLAGSKDSVTPRAS